MSVQLTIHQPDSAKEDFFKPAIRHEFAQAPILLGAEDAQCPIPGAEGDLARIVRDKRSFIIECLTSKPVVEWQGKLLRIGDKQILRSGDRLTINSCPVNFYLNFSKSPVSWQSNAFAWLAKFGIATVITIQLFCIFLLPKLLNRGQFWSGQQMRLDIISRTDQLRKEMQATDNPDPVAKMLLQAYQRDLLSRTTYLRTHSENLTRSQRKKMQQALGDIEEQVRFLQNAQLSGTLPALQIDRPIADIIEKVKYE
jgi:hypothetical protein